MTRAAYHVQIISRSMNRDGLVLARGSRRGRTGVGWREQKRTGRCSKPMTRVADHGQIISGSVKRDGLVLAGAAGRAKEDWLVQ